jgi:putative transposase
MEYEQTIRTCQRSGTPPTAAVRAIESGDSGADVARIMGVGIRSIYRWLEQAKLPDGLAAKPHPGSAPRLSIQQQQELETLLRQGAKAHGWANELWTTQRIADLIQRHLVSASITIMWVASSGKGLAGRRKNPNGVRASETSAPSNIGRASRFPRSCTRPGNAARM